MASSRCIRPAWSAASASKQPPRQVPPLIRVLLAPSGAWNVDLRALGGDGVAGAILVDRGDLDAGGTKIDPCVNHCTVSAKARAVCSSVTKCLTQPRRRIARMIGSLDRPPAATITFGRVFRSSSRMPRTRSLIS